MHKRGTTELYTHERKLLIGAVSFVVFATMTYMYFLSASIVHVVVRKEVSREISTISSQISVLEADYIAAQHAVSEDIAAMRGFSLATSKTFIEPAQTTFVLSQNNDS